MARVAACGAPNRPHADPGWCVAPSAVDQFGQVIDVLTRPSGTPPRPVGPFIRALCQAAGPAEVTTDAAPAYLGVRQELLPAACQVTERYGNNRVDADDGRLNARLRPIRGLKRLTTAAVIAAGHGVIQNLHRGHDELGTDVAPELRLTTAFAELTPAM